MITQSAASNNSASSAEIERCATPRAVVVPRSTLADSDIDAMYRLYSQNYADTGVSVFRRDLGNKTHVLLLTDEFDSLCGFSTLELYTSSANDRAVRIIYSGDTIIDPAHWGSSALAFEWLRFAGQTYREDPVTPLYWLLIVKGHRTYRFLSTFARRYVPHHKSEYRGDWQDLLNTLAAEKFGAEFDPATGIVRPATPCGRLTAELADIPERHRRLGAVRYFLERNPGYRDGDELVCICELCPENLRPLAMRVFSPAAH